MKEWELTILFTPSTKLLPKMSGRKVQEIAHDRVTLGARRETRT